MKECHIFAGIKCPCAESCPFANECKETQINKTPFLKELCCLNTTLYELSKQVQEQETRLPHYTVNETFYNVLWLFRGAIEKAAKAVFEMGEIQHDFATFEKCVTLWERTIRETNANFLREAFMPLRSQIRLHDYKEKGSPIGWVFDL